MFGARPPDGVFSRPEKNSVSPQRHSSLIRYVPRLVGNEVPNCSFVRGFLLLERVHYVRSLLPGSSGQRVPS